MNFEAKFWYSLLPSDKSGKYRETEGTKDYKSQGSGTLHQYEVIPLEEDTPAGLERVFKVSGNKVFPVIVNDGGELTTLDDGRRQYTFSGGAGSGYVKSQIYSPQSTVATAATGSATFSIYSTSNFFVDVDAGGRHETVAGTSMQIYYTVSTPPSGGGSSGSVTISPMAQYNQYAIKPAFVDGGGGQTETKTFLVRVGDASAQSLDDGDWGNYAFDVDS